MPNTQATPSRMKTWRATQIKTPFYIRMLLGRGFAPTLQEYDELRTGLFQGDDAMDAYIASQLNETKGKPDWSEFHRAMQAEHPTLVAGRQATSPALQALLAQTAHDPPWVDWELVKQGIEFIHSTGRTATDVLRDMALMGGYLMVAFNKTLILTGELEKGAAPRLASTAQWWLKVMQADANRAGGAGWRATLQVRWVHGLVRHQLARSSQWDNRQWGLAINQVDMAATYLGFSAVMLLGLRKCGIVVTPANSRAVMHVWKLIGWQMGVHPDWLVDSERVAIVRLRQFMFTHAPADETTHRLAAALATEPLSRSYPAFQGLKRRLAHQRHLSSSWYLLGPKLFKRLGITAPWGPILALLVLAPRAALHLVLRLCCSVLPGAGHWPARLGRKAQELAVNELQQRQKAQQPPPATHHGQANTTNMSQ